MRIEDSKIKVLTFNLDFASDVEFLNKIGNIDNYLKAIEDLEKKVKEKDDEISRLIQR